MGGHGRVQDRVVSGRRGVVVGTDGSPTATKAVEAAARLAVTQGQELIVTLGYKAKSAAALAASWQDVPDGDRWRVSPGALGEDLVQQAIRFARAVTGDAVRVRGRCEPGDPAGVLLGVADEVAAGAVVVGNVGMGRWSTRWSVPQRVVHRARCEVLVVDTEAWARRGEPVEVPSSLVIRRAG
jgi:nucleotide-binding universal stress UspA family protein